METHALEMCDLGSAAGQMCVTAGNYLTILSLSPLLAQKGVEPVSKILPTVSFNKSETRCKREREQEGIAALRLE